MFYSGKLPAYLDATFKQIRLFNPTAKVHFITDEANYYDPIFKKYGVTPWNKDSFHTPKIRQFEMLSGKNLHDFWTITATRFIYIETFLKIFELADVYHFDCDNLLYYDLEELHEKFVSKYKSMAITAGGKDKCMAGFMFIKNGEALAKMTSWWITVLSFYGVQGIQAKFGMDMVHEMSLMKAYMDTEKGLVSLPGFPPSDFCSIFDAASWGQFVDAGVKPKDLAISVFLITNPEYTVDWKKDELGRKIPYFKEVRINNLHIQSKQLHKYVS